MGAVVHGNGAKHDDDDSAEHDADDGTEHNADDGAGNSKHKHKCKPNDECPLIKLHNSIDNIINNSRTVQCGKYSISYECTWAYINSYSITINDRFDALLTNEQQELESVVGHYIVSLLDGMAAIEMFRALEMLKDNKITMR
ncbi:hypothetical protein GGI09_003834, partial [Coemansia sp. S100]